MVISQLVGQDQAGRPAYQGGELDGYKFPRLLSGGQPGDQVGWHSLCGRGSEPLQGRELVCKDDGVSKSFELNFFMDTSLYKSKIIYSIKFDECIWKFNSKEKEILKDPSKYNCNEICDRYFVNFIHKNILKNFKFIKYEDQKHDYFTFQNPENYNN